MPEGHRLRRLQMREAGHRVRGMRPGPCRQRLHHVGDLRRQSVDRVPHPQPDIRRHLIVAAARGVQTLASLTDPIGQPRLDIHVNVFQRHVEGERPGFNFRRDRV